MKSKTKCSGSDYLRIPRAAWKRSAENFEVKTGWVKRSGCVVGDAS